MKKQNLEKANFLVAKIKKTESLIQNLSESKKLIKESNQNIELLRKATKEEIESHLIEEAKRRGFKKGVCVDGKNIGPGYYRSCLMPTDDFNYSGIGQLCMGNYAIYYKGKWAEIIPTMTKEEAEQKLNCKIV